MFTDINPADAPAHIRRGATVSKPVMYRALRYLDADIIRNSKARYDERCEADDDAFGVRLDAWADAPDV